MKMLKMIGLVSLFAACLAMSGCVSVLSKSHNDDITKVSLLTVDFDPPNHNPAILAIYNVEVSDDAISLLQLYSYEDD